MSEILNFVQFNQYNLPVFIKLLAVYIGLLWLAVLAWLIRDITSRTQSFLVIIACTLLVLIGNIPGLVIYLLIRPDKTIEEGKNKELFFASVLDTHINLCGNCHNLVRTSFQYCPYCSAEVNLKCPHCNKTINASWSYCVHCNQALFKKKKLNLIFERFTEKLKAGRNKIRSFHLPKIKIKLKLPKRTSIKVEPTLNLPVKVLAAKKAKSQSKTKVIVAPVPELPKKKGRGRPAGTSDHKPRKPRADAGKKRGKYKTKA